MTSSGLATGARIFSISSARIERRPRSSSRSNFCRAIASRMRCDASGPRSEAISASSMSSSVDVSSAARLVRPREIVGDPLGSLAGTRRAGGRANSCPDRRQVIAVAAGDAGQADLAALAPSIATGAKLSRVALAVRLRRVPAASYRPGCRASRCGARPQPREAVRRVPSPARAASCGMRAAGVFGRGEKGKMCAATMSQSSSNFRLFSAISSVSVGNPAIRSAPMVASGRAALIRSTVRTASARLWRRFMRLRIMSSPA